MRRFLTFFALALIALPAYAADVSVDMLNKAPDSKERNIYAPDLVRVDVGDTVTWISVTKGHNVEFIKGGVPEGVGKFRSKLSKDVAYTFTVPGVYAYKCTPHYGLGMVGVVVVGGDTSNLEAVKAIRYPGKSKARMQAIFDQLN